MWHAWQCAAKPCEWFGKAKPAENGLEAYTVGTKSNTDVEHGVSCPLHCTQKMSPKVPATTEQNI